MNEAEAAKQTNADSNDENSDNEVNECSNDTYIVRRACLSMYSSHNNFMGSECLRRIHCRVNLSFVSYHLSRILDFSSYLKACRIILHCQILNHKSECADNASNIYLIYGI